MKLVDYVCPLCGIKEEVDIDISDEVYCCGMADMENGIVPHPKTKMKKVIPASNYRVVNYSPEYAGGNDKNLYNVHDDLGGRK